jgi:hypothetical protein
MPCELASAWSAHRWPHLVPPDMAALKHPDHVSKAPLLGHSAQSPCQWRPKLAAAGIPRLQA